VLPQLCHIDNQATITAHASQILSPLATTIRAPRAYLVQNLKLKTHARNGKWWQRLS
jgi:hypothetical protein